MGIDGGAIILFIDFVGGVGGGTIPIAIVIAIQTRCKLNVA